MLDVLYSIKIDRFGVIGIVGVLWIFDVLFIYHCDPHLREVRGKPQESFVTIFFSKDRRRSIHVAEHHKSVCFLFAEFLSFSSLA